MEFRELNTGTYALPGAVNMGLVSTVKGLVAVDTGLDKQAAKRMTRAVESLGQPLMAIINTHAHADHFGGNSTLLSRFPDAVVYAPVDEAAVIRQPQFEPQYLWQGALPFQGLQNKFLLAPASRVDKEFEPTDALVIGETVFQSIPLPGHAHGQCGILVNRVFFAADGYFGSAVTEKHGIPFLVDYERTLASAKAILSVEADWFVPGHGDATEDPRHDIDYLCTRHELVYEKMLKVVVDKTSGEARGVSLDELTGALCKAFAIEPANPGSWLLLRTSVGAYLSRAVDIGQLDITLVDAILKVIPSNR